MYSLFILYLHSLYRSLTGYSKGTKNTVQSLIRIPVVISDILTELFSKWILSWHGNNIYKPTLKLYNKLVNYGWKYPELANKDSKFSDTWLIVQLQEFCVVIEKWQMRYTIYTAFYFTVSYQCRNLTIFKIGTTDSKNTA